MTESVHEAAERQFRSYDFGSDAKYKEYRNAATIISSGSEEELEEKLRRKYFRKEVNPSLRVTSEAVASERGSGSNATTTRTTAETRASSGSSGRSGSSQYDGNRLSQFEEVIRRIARPETMLALHGFLLVCAVLTILPFASALLFYRKVHTAAFVIGILNVMVASGVPRRDRRWWSLVLRKQDAQYLFFSLAFRIATHPEIMSIIPPAIFSFYGFIDAGLKLLQTYVAPEHHRHFRPIAGKALAFRRHVVMIIPVMEPAILGQLILKMLITRQRDPFLLVSFFQFCRWRYQVCQESRDLWHRLDARVTSFTANYPRMGSLFVQARSFISQTGTILDLAQGPGRNVN